MPSQRFTIHVEKDYLKFNAAHFIAYRGFREALHGHNYRVSVDIEGVLGAQGYVVDFGVVKKAARAACERLNERMIIPARSDCLRIRETGAQIIVEYEQDEFRFPRADVLLLPLVHSSVEELAQYLLGEIRRDLTALGLSGVHSIEVGVAETHGQIAYCREEV